MDRTNGRTVELGYHGDTVYITPDEDRTYKGLAVLALICAGLGFALELRFKRR
jgi:hypothetical protein